MARVCSMLRVPRPERGYWAKLSVGRAPTRTPLPEARPGDQLVWLPGGGLPPSPEFSATPALKAPVSRPRQRVTGTHALVRGAQEHFLSGRPTKEGRYLQPFKKLLVDVTASQGCLDKALDVANTFLTHWNLRDIGLSFHQPIGFTIVPISRPESRYRRNHTITIPTTTVPCGRPQDQPLFMSGRSSMV